MSRLRKEVDGRHQRNANLQIATNQSPTSCSHSLTDFARSDNKRERVEAKRKKKAKTTVAAQNAPSLSAPFSGGY